jgi:hypothetical protein
MALTAPEHVHAVALIGSDRLHTVTPACDRRRAVWLRAAALARGASSVPSSLPSSSHHMMQLNVQGTAYALMRIILRCLLPAAARSAAPSLPLPPATAQRQE